MAERYREFQSLGVGVLAVSMCRPEAVARYLVERPLPFPLLADSDRRAYAAFGLGRTTWGRIMRPGVMWRYSKLIVQGAKVRRVAEGEDPLQTGGDFLIGADWRLRWSYTSPDPTDRPSVDQLLDEVRRSLGRMTTPEKSP